MIVGIGIDTVVISRIERLMSMRGEQFLKKVFTESEIAEGTKRADGASFFAARFAAREAFLKALGTGYGKGLNLKEISVATTDAGQPYYRLSDRAAQAVEECGATRTHLSLTHDGDIASAVAILEGA